jgi:hypothetical protein
MVPYLAWLTLAAALNLSIVWMNPDFPQAPAASPAPALVKKED